MNMMSETSTIYDVAKTKLFADIQLEHAKTSLFQLGGAGLLAVMLGAGIGLACFGFSYVVDGRAQAEKMADAMVQALEKAHLTTTGEVKLADGSIVGLAPGGQVTLAPNSTARVDPSSTVRITGTVPADARATNTIPIIQTSPALENKVVTQYTIFKTVAFERGHVVTGWSFENSNQTNPSNQYCYYDEPGDDKTHIRIDLGENGTMFNQLQSRVGLDPTAAFGNCNWFRGA
jgi:hypothetical protein